jgi:hypothetical protein
MIVGLCLKGRTKGTACAPLSNLCMACEGHSRGPVMGLQTALKGPLLSHMATTGVAEHMAGKGHSGAVVLACVACEQITGTCVLSRGTRSMFSSIDSNRLQNAGRMCLCRISVPSLNYRQPTLFSLLIVFDRDTRK